MPRFLTHPGTILPPHSAQVSELTLEWWNGPKRIIEEKKNVIMDFLFVLCAARPNRTWLFL